MVQIIQKPEKCENLIVNHYKSILDSYGYKKILNDWYQPEKYLFFLNDGNLLPLVIKDNMATFYGGTQFNNANFVPEDKTLINFAIEYLLTNNYSFRLLSITNDIFDHLDKSIKQYDVPYPPQWIYPVSKPFDPLEYIRQKPTKKKRKDYKYTYNRRQHYRFETISFSQFEKYFPTIIQKQILYFDQRGIDSAWKNKESLFFSILKYFNEHEKLFMRCIFHHETIVGFYAIVYNQNEMILYFGGTFEFNDYHLSKIWYFDMLEQSTQLAYQLNIAVINASRGCFTNKKRFGFIPHPLYGLVNDENWIVMRDKSITVEECQKVYRRNFGAEMTTNCFDFYPKG